MKIEKIGWENENPVCPFILLSKAEREKLGLEVGKLVNVSKKINDGSNEAKVSATAKVEKQFKQYLGVEEICSMNSKLAEKINVKEGDEIEIENNVTESQAKSFHDSLRDAMFFGVL